MNHPSRAAILGFLLAGCGTLTEPRVQPPGAEWPVLTASLSPGVSPVPPPLSYWPADGSFADLANGDNGGTPLGGVGFATGYRGLAFQLDGTGEIELVHSGDLELADGDASMTVGAWVKPTLPLPDVFHLAAVISFNYACSEPAIGIHVTDADWPFSPHPNGVLFGVRDETAVLYQAGEANVFQADDWHHIISVRDGPANELRLYIDGHLRTLQTDLSGTIQPLRNALGQFVVAPQNGAAVVNSPDRIGAVSHPCATKRFFTGLIDEVKVWNVVLTDEEILAEARPTASSGGPYAGVEGTTVQFDGSGSTDPAAGGLTYSWDFGDGTTSSGAAPTHSYSDNRSYPVALTVTNVHGASATASTTAIVANTPPAVISPAGPTDPLAVGISATITASFSDAGILDTHTATIDWGDGTTPTTATVVEANGAGQATGSHAYPSPGVYTVTITVLDDDGGQDQGTVEFVVVYDPAGGFVTGGGWVNSPLGAYAADPSLTGKANFGFVSKYKNGASKPTGNTEFQFKAGDLNFHSEEYDWLVVAGARAHFKGQGQINNAGDYGFMLTAIDGALPGGGGVDRFRIKIWNHGTGGVIYDNQMSAGDAANPTTQLGGGNIVIHK